MMAACPRIEDSWNTRNFRRSSQEKAAARASSTDCRSILLPLIEATVRWNSESARRKLSTSELSARDSWHDRSRAMLSSVPRWAESLAAIVSTARRYSNTSLTSALYSSPILSRLVAPAAASARVQVVDVERGQGERHDALPASRHRVQTWVGQQVTSTVIFAPGASDMRWLVPSMWALFPPAATVIVASPRS
jgi:hypothetical protein